MTIESVIKSVNIQTGRPHLIWDCQYSIKSCHDNSVSNTWHFDNHYSHSNPKLMIYLNPQEQELGGTDFVDIECSQRIASITNYVGLLWQRKDYKKIVAPFRKELKLSKDTFEPNYYRFSPNIYGSGIWFLPSKVLHRGVMPKKGRRHVITFSMVPLPLNEGWNTENCIESSLKILKDKIKNKTQKYDYNPFWLDN